MTDGELMRLADDGCPNCPEHLEWGGELLWEYMMRFRRELFLAVLGGEVSW